MIPDHHQPPAPGHDENLTLVPRRAFPRRSLLGITALGVAALVTACGEDDDPED